MKISKRKISWMSVSCALALLTGLPAVADDTELLLINPDPSQNPKPNVMFILDTSGSMKTTQTTTDPYNSTLVYPGDCDTNAIYWTDVDVTPVSAVLPPVRATAFTSQPMPVPPGHISDYRTRARSHVSRFIRRIPILPMQQPRARYGVQTKSVVFIALPTVVQPGNWY